MKNNQSVMGISLIVPVYNSSQSLPELVARIDSALPAERYLKELILVNDGSRDESWDVVQQLVQGHAWVKGINLMRNYGQHNALLVGINHSQYESIVTLDDDLQHPPEEIPTLIGKLTSDIDVVYGVPHEVQHHGVQRWGSLIVRALISRMMGNSIAKEVSAFRLFRARLTSVFHNYHGDYVNVDALLCWATTKFAATTITHQPRKYGKTNYTFKKNLLHAVNMITGFSVLPLQMASILGFLLVVFGITVFIYVLANYLITHGAVQGFTFTIATVAIFSGVQMFCLGIIGAYLARIHLRNLGKPVALIKEIKSRG